MIRNYKEGGLKALDFTTINQTFKINWIKNCLSNNELPWFWIPNLIFKCCGDLKFLLSCNFKCSKLPIKLSNFHKQALDSWKIAFKHNFSPHTCIIWNNENILSGNKSLFFFEWVNHFFISDLFNAQGDLLSFPDFVSLKAATISLRDYNKVNKSIPVSLKTLFKAHLYYGSINNHFPTLAFNGVYVLDKKCNNVFIRNALSLTPGCPSKAQSKWRICYPDSDLNNLWTFPHRFFIPSKVKELHFKIVHRYYPCNLFLSRFFENISSLCSFCNTGEESILHLFCHFPFSKSFWSEVTFLISFCCKQIICYLLYNKRIYYIPVRFSF